MSSFILTGSGNLSGDLSGSADKNSSRQNRWSLTGRFK